MAETARKLIDTDHFSARLRAGAVDLANQRLLVTNFHNTSQEKDLTEPPNCNGFGRIRHFRRRTSEGWPDNPLPIDPACQSLGLARADVLRAQAFQNAVCNWRCWYCFVPFDLLSANPTHSAWLSATELLDLYLAQPNPPPMIDLTGGQPDLIPEWIVWMMQAIKARGLEHAIYLWSDDNLSNDYFWRFLSDQEIELIVAYPTYGRVCCFKGLNETSLSFNTLAEPKLFDRQFQLLERLLNLGLDIYAYATFTSPSATGIADDMRQFVDRLQTLNENLPLRTIPLEIKVFTPVGSRLDETKRAALEHQQIAIECWQCELERRFAATQRLVATENISAVQLQSRKLAVSRS